MADLNEFNQKGAAAKAPPLLDLTIDNLTENVARINSQVEDARMRFLITELVKASHDFVRRTQLQSDEWEAAWRYLTAVGHKSSDVRHEFVLLSDILGISALVDAISYPQKGDATESSVLGPFFDEHAPEVANGDSIASENKGEKTLVRGKVRNTDGKPIAHCLIDIWETDGDGLYDLQMDDLEGPDMRGKVYTRDDGTFEFGQLSPVSYPIPNDGPVGMLLRKLNRHYMRPAHMHFKLAHPDHNSLTTALYTREDKYIASDTVFGVKSSLMVDYKHIKANDSFAKEVKVDFDFWYLEKEFILMKKTPSGPRKTSIS